MELRKEKNYALADKIRDRLNEIGIEIQDTSDGTTWKIN
jgi:cysteinyl-tRNA synthetase